jgi:glycosyltransferase involved in cell wall biosynthesis
MAQLAVWPGVASTVQFLDTTKRTDAGRFARVTRPLRLLRELHHRLREQPECALAFSSAYFSFWEKAAWLLLCRWHQVPMAVMMVDGNFPNFYRSLPAPMRALARALLVRFSTVIVQTESWRNYYQSIAPRGRYAVLSNGVDCREFTPVPKVPSPKPTLLFVGWTIPEKGIFDLLEAAAIVRDRGRDFILEIVGPFHGHEEKLREVVAARGLDTIVQIVGPVHSRVQLLDVYRHADVYVLPSWAEGLPVAMLEAMACGLPVVATNVGGVPDLVREGVCGSLVPPRNPGLLADALDKLLLDPTLRSSMAAEARRRVESVFSTEKFMLGLLTLLRSRGRMPA